LTALSFSFHVQQLLKEKGLYLLTLGEELYVAVLATGFVYKRNSSSDNGKLSKTSCISRRKHLTLHLPWVICPLTGKPYFPQAGFVYLALLQS